MIKTEKGREIANDMVDANMLSIRCFKTKNPPLPSIISDEELKSIKVPVLYLAGENDKILAVKDAVKKLNNLAPEIKTEIIPNSDHGLVLAHPELVNKKNLDFLDN